MSSVPTSPASNTAAVNSAARATTQAAVQPATQSAAPESAHPAGTLAGVGTTEPERWQRQLATAIRSRDTLLQRLGLAGHPQLVALSATEKNGGHAADAFGTLVPESFVRRMVPGDACDPLLRQVLPDPAEQAVVDGFVSDPVGDAAARAAQGVLHKYQGRVLLITTGACAVHCRYCFRRNYPYHAEPKRLADWQPALDYIAASTDISEVILSGGDPLTLTDDRLGELCRAIDGIAHVQRIRFHTRLPIVLPARVTDELLACLLSLRVQPIMVVHANHGQEIQADCREALQRLVRSGVVTLNQAVLLAGINDTVDAQVELSENLINIGVMPYYLHQLDRVTGAAHFETDSDLGLQLVDAMAERLPGYAVPKLVKEVAGAHSKTPVEKLAR
ncbi:MAG: EF-P beta-lysylation protein EpmB [Planctomycetaceae bacterium]|nr:EF-P beta-lysylation protein EpmB [Planctomycetaceae bacterium]